MSLYVDHYLVNAVFNLVHPQISIYILHTLLYTFLKVLTRRICLTIKAPQVGDYLLSSHDPKE